MLSTKTINVAVAIVYDERQQILIAKRSAEQHQGNLWEFPGGKVEATETNEQALKRELQEEVGIHVQSANYMMTIEHSYPDVSVHLQIYQVHDFTGAAQGCENQEIRWVSASELTDYAFPKANDALIQALIA